jgi:uncharacterized protein with NRDE domain
MCLIAFHWDPGGAVPLVAAGNRDEFYARPTAPLAWWEGGHILAGRDLRAGGTWLGLSAEGRFAALTNHRDPALARPEGPSRGLLPVRFLKGRQSAGAFLRDLSAEAGRYAPFNLLLFDGTDLLGYESRHGRLRRFEPGLHIVSNGDFDEPWPKAVALLAGLGPLLADDEALFARLAAPEPFPDEDLPRTGVGLVWERVLSPIFIRTGTYGTRAATVVRVGREEASITERRFSREGPGGQHSKRFRLRRP